MKDAQGQTKEGYLRKRGGRMLRWTHRYFILSGSKLSYKLKADSSPSRGDFDLDPGCKVTEIVEDYSGTIKGKKIFVFWVVWPHDRKLKGGEAGDDKHITAQDDSDDEEDNKDAKENTDVKSSLLRMPSQKSKFLKDIIEQDQQKQKDQQKKVEEQIVRHQAHDKFISAGAKLAALAAGGVVVGVFTAGIGLIPYVTVAGLAAAAGGGVAVMQVRTNYKRPSDSRLVLACDTMDEACAWKTAIEAQISKLERKPALPLSADPRVISSIINIKVDMGCKVVHIYEGMRILEFLHPSPGTKCWRTQLVVKGTPFCSFLTLMDGHCWPDNSSNSSIEVVKTVDDHTDIVCRSLEVALPCGLCMSSRYVKRKISMSRFWKLDEDGIYLIALNRCRQDDQDSSSPDIGVDAVITISPRKDNSEYDDDLSECLVQCTCQLTNSGKMWCDIELNTIMLDIMKQLVELQQHMLTQRYTAPMIATSPTTANPHSSHVAHAHSNISPASGQTSNHFGLSSPDTWRRGSINNLQSDPSARSVSVLLSPKTASYQYTGTTASVVKIDTNDTVQINMKTSGSLRASGEKVVSETAPKPPKKRYIFSGNKKQPLDMSHDDSYLYNPSSHARSSLLQLQNPEELSTAATSGKRDSAQQQPSSLSRVRYNNNRAVSGRHRSRTLAVNTEASRLRSEIQSLEFQLQRLLKSSKINEVGNNDDLIAEIDALKQKYQRVTKTQYDEQQTVNRNSLRSRFVRRSHDEQSAIRRAALESIAENIPSNSTGAYCQFAMSVTSSRITSGTSAASIPRHWSIPTRTLRCDLWPSIVVAETNSVADAHQKSISSFGTVENKSELMVNVFLMLWICVSILATVLVSKVMSSI